METPVTAIVPANGVTPIPEDAPAQNAAVMYTKASELVITPEEQAGLQNPVDEKKIEIRPDGLIYLPQVFVRDTLNRVLGIGQWALIQHKVWNETEKNKLYFDGSLYIRGYFVARALGEAQYHENNKLQSWASVYEAGKSDCLVRCCKDLGIAKECWEPQFARSWVNRFALKVWRKDTGESKAGKKGSFQWRRKDSEPFWDESRADTKPTGEFVDKETGEVFPFDNASTSAEHDLITAVCAELDQTKTVAEVETWAKRHKSTIDTMSEQAKDILNKCYLAAKKMRGAK